MVRRKKVGDMGSYTRSTKDWDAYRWCLENKIYIAPLAQSSNTWFIDIILNGKVIRDPSVYGKKEIWVKIYEYYKYYYDKKNKGRNTI